MLKRTAGGQNAPQHQACGAPCPRLPPLLTLLLTTPPPPRCARRPLFTFEACSESATTLSTFKVEKLQKILLAATVGAYTDNKNKNVDYFAARATYNKPIATNPIL